MVRRCHTSGRGHGRGRDVFLPTPLVRPGSATGRVVAPRGVENLWRLTRRPPVVGNQGSQATVSMATAQTQTGEGRGQRLLRHLGLASSSISTREDSSAPPSDYEDIDDMSSNVSSTLDLYDR